MPDRDNKETLFVKEEVTDDAEVFGEVVVVVVVVVVVDVGRAGGITGSHSKGTFIVGIVVVSKIYIKYPSRYNYKLLVT